jgi:hypothetical protein
MPRFDPEAILRVLESHQVRYVLIGGLAATLHGSPIRTGDADICPSQETGNLDRLAAALDEMGARIRSPDAPEGLPFSCDAAFLRKVQMLNLVTRYGELDISLEPSGTVGYSDLVQNAVKYDLAGLVVPVAALADIIRSKEAAGRAKDKAMLPTLRTLLREIRRSDSDG